jgi:hypothetical protein
VEDLLISLPKKSSVWIAVGVAAGLLLHGVAGWWSLSALAQISNNTFTTSTSSSTGFESPPACTPVGSSRSAQTITLEDAIGPATIIVGNRDNGGTAFEVLAGTSNTNVNTHTATFQCVAAVPALPLPGLVGMGLALGGIGAWMISRRRQHRRT